MTVRRAVPILVLATALLFTLSLANAQAPTVEALLEAASDYVAAYASKVSGVSLEEQYTITEVSGGRMSTPQRLSSDVVLLNLDGKVISLRDAYAIDNSPMRERQPRIISLLTKPTTETWEQAQAYASESFRHMKHELIARLNEPTLALQFLSADYKNRVTFKLDGKKKLDGIETFGLRFQEPKNKEQSYIMETRGKALSSGRLWTDPATGRVHQTELWLQSGSETVRVTVTYAREATLGLWLPSTMFDEYQTSERTGEFSNMGAGGYNARQDFQCRATYSNARYTPIELSVPKRP
jgi:outer membrane lipoprotein-sorting protein